MGLVSRLAGSQRGHWDSDINIDREKDSNLGACILPNGQSSQSKKKRILEAPFSESCWRVYTNKMRE